MRKLTPNSPATKNGGRFGEPGGHLRTRNLAGQILGESFNVSLKASPPRLVGVSIREATSAAALATLASVLPSNHA